MIKIYKEIHHREVFMIQVKDIDARILKSLACLVHNNLSIRYSPKNKDYTLKVGIDEIKNLLPDTYLKIEDGNISALYKEKVKALYKYIKDVE